MAFQVRLTDGNIENFETFDAAYVYAKEFIKRENVCAVNKISWHKQNTLFRWVPTYKDKSNWLSSFDILCQKSSVFNDAKEVDEKYFTTSNNVCQLFWIYQSLTPYPAYIYDPNLSKKENEKNYYRSLIRDVLTDEEFYECYNSTIGE